MHKSYTYWDNRYKVGEINFIKTSAQNLQRKFFIDWLSKADHVKSILEVGPGEMLEYQSIRSKRPDIKYAISDVSMIFIENCKQKYPAVDTYRVSLEELDTINKEFDCIYICQVLEHSVNIRKAIKNAVNIAKEFHFVFFKWRWRGGGLESKYYESKNLCSTEFNIWKIIDEIKKHGNIEYSNVISRKGNTHTLKEYQDLKGTKRSRQRDRNWLAIHGIRK
jgi:hypothetical protein